MQGESPLSQLYLGLSVALPQLRGAWVAARSNYEAAVAEVIDADVIPARYYDCVMRETGLRLELKKTSTGSMWFDLVRYSEAVLEPALAEGVVTLVLRYRRTPEPLVTHIAVAQHHALVAALNLDREVATQVRALRARTPYSLNAQASLPWGMICEIATRVIQSSDDR